MKKSEEKQTTLTLFYDTDGVLMRALRLVTALEEYKSQRQFVEHVILQYIKKNHPDIIERVTKK
jgi:hypothetical protein